MGMDIELVDDEDDEETSETVWMVKGRGRAARFSDHAKELVYQMWAFQYAGNARKVSEALERQTPPITVDERSIRQWAKDGQWAIRRADDWRQIAPDLMRQTIIETRYGLLETAIEMRSIVTNTRTRRIERVSSDGEATTVEEVPEVQTKDRIAAGKLLNDIDSELRMLALADAPVERRSDEPLDTSPAAAAERIRQRRAGYQGG